MLVLTRRPGESIVIGDGIKLTVVSVGPGRVKIGIEAPASVKINREEIHTRIQQELAHEHTDVFEAVSRGTADVGHADQATMITSGGDTGILNRGNVEATLTSDDATTVPANSIRKFRAPRKPR